MKFFKYLFLLFSFFFVSNTYAACEAGVSAAFESTLADPPYTVCAASSSFGGSKCVFEIYSMNKIGNKFDMFGTSTGATCTAETNLDAVPDPDSPLVCTGRVCQNPEDKACPSGYTKGMYNGVLSCVKNETTPDTLQCNQDTCPNPDNLRCPSGYVSGTVNGQNVCSRSNNPDPDPEDPTCEGNDCSDEGVIAAVNDAKRVISDAINSVGDAVSQGFSDAADLLQRILDKQGTGGDGNNNGGCEGDDCGDGVDTSGLVADVPYNELEQMTLDENLFQSNAQCPPDTTLNLNPFNRSVSKTFSYQPVCDAFEILGYFILTLAYAYAAYIVGKA